MAEAYDPHAIETSWQARWEREQTYRTRDDLPREQCYYVLEMFPYPSGKLHMGHVRNYSIGDAVARYQRMRGFHVLHPMGWDSFGLPAEQAAIERGLPPKNWTYDNIDHMRGQLKRMGFSYDWQREFATSDAEYAKREQALFLDLVEKGLVYRKSSLVNWSTGLNTVLANEQVIDGTCWRTGEPVIQKELPQWFVRTTAYAPELLEDIEQLQDWPEAVKIMQRNWLGRSEGAEIDFPVQGQDDCQITVFTTRPDTVFGVTFMSLAPEHELVDRIVTEAQRPAIEAFRAELAGQSEEERCGDQSPKRGVFTGAYAINPASGEAVPVYAANFVLAGYGTGAVMAVPAHDSRDFAFATAHQLPIRKVILEDGTQLGDELSEAFTEVGTMVASAAFDGQRSDAAKAAIVNWLEAEGKGRRRVTWRYRDWGVSRQRYWGNPIPYVFSETMGAVPLNKQDLPVALPEDVVLDGSGNPLENHATWKTTTADGSPLTVKTTSGREPATRETDTMDTFVESSWYFARYCCHNNQAADLGCEAPLDQTRVDHWLPVDLYIGGIEHACLHLLYARFWQKAMCDLGYSQVREPFRRLLCQGMVVKETYYREGEDGKKIWISPDEVEVETNAKGKVIAATHTSDGKPVLVGRVEKMSKSKNNGVDPQQLVDQYGADAARLFALFAAPPDKDLDWDDAGLAGCYRFLKRLWVLVIDNLDAIRDVQVHSGVVADAPAADQPVVRKVHATIKRATDAMERDFGFNATIAACMELANELKIDKLTPEVFVLGLHTLLRLLAPMSPHLCHELWARLGHQETVDEAGWPDYDESQLVEDEIEYPVQVKGKRRCKIRLPAGLDKTALEEAALAHPDVQAVIGAGQVRKLIAVPGKIINLVL